MNGPTYVLIDEDDANVLALRREAIKRSLDGRVVRLGVDHQEVLLRFGWCGHML